MGMLQDYLMNLDEEQASSLIDSLDDEMIEDSLRNGIETQIIPHMEEIKEAATHKYEDRQEVREYYESLPPEEQEEKFHEAAADLIAIAQKLRNHPQAGGSDLKNRLRDPWLTEALLLMFNHPDISGEVSEEQKDFAATWLKYVGISVIPEAYTEEEIDGFLETMFPNADPQEARERIGVDQMGNDE